MATWQPNETAVLEVIQEFGLELQIIFNKGSRHGLAGGMNKATGLAAALKDFEFSFHNVVGVGDAENDHAFLRACCCAAAVANALPMVKAAADIRLGMDHGSGVIELVERDLQRGCAHSAAGAGSELGWAMIVMTARFTSSLIGAAF